MKYIIITIFSIYYCTAQELVFTEIDSAIKGSKDELFVKSKSWAATYFKDAKSVIQLDDKEAGKLICKGAGNVPVKNGFGEVCYYDKLWFLATINVKDNKTRIIISDFSHQSNDPHTDASVGRLLNPQKNFPRIGFNKYVEKLKKRATEQAQETLSNYHQFMHSASASDDKF